MLDPDKVEAFPSSPGEKELRIDQVRAWIERSPDIPAQLKTEILKNVATFVESERITPAGKAFFRTGQIGWTRWAVRDDQLNLLGALTPAALAIVAYATAVAGSPFVLAAALLFALLNVASRLKTKGVILEPDAYRVLMGLKETGPSSLEDLTRTLNVLKFVGPSQFPESRVRELLDHLKSIRANDGTLEALVVKGSDGKWSANGV